MVKPFKTPIYQAMDQASKVNKEYDDYLQSLDKEYGTQLSVRSYKDVTKMKKEMINMAIDNEDHFDDLAAGVEPEEPDYDEDEVLVEEDDTEPYTTKDIAKGVVDLLNSASMDWETGSYYELDDAAEALGSLIDRKGLNISEDEFDRIFGDGDYFILQKYMENNPHDAEMIFNTVAKAFGFSNYKDYITYEDWIIEPEDELEEATNAGAITSVPGKHIRIDLDEEDEDDPNN